MKRKILSLALATILVGFGALGMPRQVYADEGNEEDKPTTSLQISPTAVTVTLMGGDVLSGTSERCPKDVEGGCVVQVKNVGTQSFRYRVYASPYVVSGEDYQLDFSESASTSYTQISRWITFKNPEGNYESEAIYTINPGETQVIDYRISVPEDVPGGAQYAVVWAQTLSEGGSGVQTISQAGMVISGRSIGNTKQTAEILEYGFTRFAVGGSLKANATIKNTGNTDFDAYYYYTARTIFGKELKTLSGSVSTFPDTEYHVNLDWDEPPLMGIFQVEFKVNAADTIRDEKHIVIIMPIFMIVIIILLLTVIIVWTIIIIRKRKERKARTLV